MLDRREGSASSRRPALTVRSSVDRDAIQTAFETAIIRCEVDAAAAWELAISPYMDADEPLAGLAAAVMRDLAILSGAAVDAAYVAALDHQRGASLADCLELALLHVHGRWR